MAASTGPRFSKRGDRRITTSRYIQTEWLQRGRAFPSAEMLHPVVIQCQDLMLQRGRAFPSAEMRSHLSAQSAWRWLQRGRAFPSAEMWPSGCIHDQSSAASTGPRFSKRGDRAARDHIAGWRSASTGPRFSKRGDLFNYFAIPPHEIIASTGPRFSKRGDA